MSCIIGFVGLPSAGKSSMINSLVGKRCLKTGTCRTTTEMCFIGNKNTLECENFIKKKLVSDDGIEYSIIDLPGLADAENIKEESDFTNLTFEVTKKCDIVLWVTDINSAFITSHEKIEFDKLIEKLDKHSLETGKLHKYGIILSKYEINDESGTESYTDSETESDTDEISENIDEISEETGDEDTTLLDHVIHVEKLFKDYSNITISKFNAFGRILHKKGISAALKKVVKKKNIMGIDVNTDFNIRWACDNFHKHQQELLLRIIVNLSQHYNNVEKIKSIIESISDMSILIKFIHFIMISSSSDFFEYSTNIIKIPYTYSTGIFSKFKSLDICSHINEKLMKQLMEILSWKKIYKLQNNKRRVFLDVYDNEYCEIYESCLEKLWNKCLGYDNNYSKMYLKIVSPELNSFTHCNYNWKYPCEIWTKILASNNIFICRITLKYYNVEIKNATHSETNKKLLSNIFELDRMIKNNPQLGILTNVHKKISSIRQQLWGNNDSKLTNISNIVSSYENGNLLSLFVPIRNGYIHKISNISIDTLFS